MNSVLFDENDVVVGVAGGQPGQEDVPAVPDDALAAAVLAVPLAALYGRAVAAHADATRPGGFRGGRGGFGHQFHRHL